MFKSVRLVELEICSGWGVVPGACLYGASSGIPDSAGKHLRVRSREQRFRHAEGFTRIELVVALGTLIILGLCVLPALRTLRIRKDRTACVSNLYALGMSYHSYAGDSDNRLPWEVPMKERGSSGQGKASEHYRVLSNYINNPQILLCSTARMTRSPAQRMSLLVDSNVSYSLGVDTQYMIQSKYMEHPGNPGFTAADFDIENEGLPVTQNVCPKAGSIRIDEFKGDYGNPRTFTAKWGSACHPQFGLLLGGDGSVVVTDNQGLRYELSISQDVGNVCHILKPTP